MKSKSERFEDVELYCSKHFAPLVLYSLTEASFPGRDHLCHVTLDQCNAPDRQKNTRKTHYSSKTVTAATSLHNMVGLEGVGQPYT